MRDIMSNSMRMPGLVDGSAWFTISNPRDINGAIFDDSESDDDMPGLEETHETSRFFLVE